MKNENKAKNPHLKSKMINVENIQTYTAAVCNYIGYLIRIKNIFDWLNEGIVFLGKPRQSV